MSSICQGHARKTFRDPRERRRSRGGGKRGRKSAIEARNEVRNAIGRVLVDQQIIAADAVRYAPKKTHLVAGGVGRKIVTASALISRLWQSAVELIGS